MLRKKIFSPDITYGCNIAEDKDQKQKYSSFSDEEDFSIKTESPPIKIETSLLGSRSSDSSDSSELPDLKLPISYHKGKYILLISHHILRHIFYKSFEKQINISILTHYSFAKKEESNKRRE